MTGRGATRLMRVLPVPVVCAIGGVVLLLLGTPPAAAVAITVLAAAATAFSRWARALRVRRGSDSGD